MNQMLQVCSDATHATLKRMVASSIKHLAQEFAVSEDEVRTLWMAEGSMSQAASESDSATLKRTMASSVENLALTFAVSEDKVRRLGKRFQPREIISVLRHF
jgi:hypothetical protein